MKWQPIVLVLAIAGIASHSAAGDEIDDKILHAYTEAPNVATEIKSFGEQGYVDRGARSMLVSTSCGVAGCSYEYLVVHLFSYGGANPQDRSILARVHANTLGMNPKVELVELTPKQEPPVSEGVPAPNQKLRVIGESPAPTPKISAEPPESNP